MKAKTPPHAFDSGVTRVTKPKGQPLRSTMTSLGPALRPAPFLVHALPLRSRKVSR